jgi:hypothetical protein
MTDDDDSRLLISSSFCWRRGVFLLVSLAYLFLVSRYDLLRVSTATIFDVVAVVLFVTAETLLFVAVVVAFIEVGLFVTDASFFCCLPPFRELKTFGEEDGIVNVNVCGNSKKINKKSVCGLTKLNIA